MINPKLYYLEETLDEYQFGHFTSCYEQDYFVNATSIFCLVDRKSSNPKKYTNGQYNEDIYAITLYEQ